MRQQRIANECACLHRAAFVGGWLRRRSPCWELALRCGYFHHQICLALSTSCGRVSQGHLLLYLERFGTFRDAQIPTIPSGCVSTQPHVFVWEFWHKCAICEAILWSEVRVMLLQHLPQKQGGEKAILALPVALPL